MSKIVFTEEGVTPTPPAVNQVSMYVKTDEVLYILDSSGIETPLGSSAAITQLIGEATAVGPGVTTITLNNSSVISKVLTSFSAGPNSPVLATDSILIAIEKLQAQVSGTSGTAITQLTGDVTAVGPGSVSAIVAFVGGSSAANIHSAELAANAATSANTASTIVKRDASGDFAAHIITALTFMGDLTGNVTGNVSGTASNVTGIVAIVNGGTNSNTPLNNNRIMISVGGAIVEASAITTNRALVSNGSGIPIASVTTTTELSYVSGVTSSIQTQLNAITGSSITALTGDVSAVGPGSVPATVNFVGGSSAANVHSAELLANAATAANTPLAIVRRDASGNFVAGTITASLTGNVTGSASNNVLKAGDTMSGELFITAAGTGLNVSNDVFIGGALTVTGTISASNFSGSSSGTNTGDVTLTAVGSSPNANGASLSGQVLTLQPADATHPGLLTAIAQSIGGTKTFVAAMSVAPGSVSLPGLYLSTDTTTGLYRPAVDQLNITVAGAKVANFGTSGLAITGVISATTSVTAAEFISATANPATVGVLRLANSEFIEWRNAANTANLGLQLDASDIFQLASALTVSGNINASNFSGSSSGSNTGDVTITDTNSIDLTLVGQALSADLRLSSDAADAGNLKATVSIHSGGGAGLHVEYPFSTPVNVGTTNFIGAANSFSLSDHVHAIGSTTVTGLLLTGYVVGTNTPLTATNSILIAFENLQAQINATVGAAITALTGDVTASGPGSAAATVVKIQGTSVSNTAPTDAQLLIYNSGTSKWTPASISGDTSLTDTGATKVLAIQNISVSNAVPTDAQLLIYNSGTSKWTPASMTGDVTISDTGVSTIGVGAVTDTKGSLSNKPAVTVVATTNQTLSGAPTIDGQATTAGTSIALLTAQSTGSQNGPWVVQSGAWTRPTWFPTGGTTQAFQFITMLVRLGTVYQGSTWRLTTAGAITIDTTTTAWAVTPQAGNYRADYTVGTRLGAAAVSLNFANANIGTLAWNPGSTQTITLPPNLVGAGSYLADSGSGVLIWTNPLVNIDGGRPDSVYTASQFVNGGTP